MDDLRELEYALEERERAYRSALDQLDETEGHDLTENEVHDFTALLREAVEVVGCARRLTRGRTLVDIRAAFGSPGDFGYETPLGEALARTYRVQR
jgi:hypothetical protein